MNKISIKGLGYAFPEKQVTNKDLEKEVETSDEWIVQRTGMKIRYFSDEDSVSSLGIAAAKKAIEESKTSPEEIDLVIAASSTHDYTSGPFTSGIIADAIGAKNAVSIDINIACAGFVYSLELAENYIKSGKYKNVLIVNGEVWTKLPNFFENRTTAVIFGDGASAAVVSPEENLGIDYTILKTDTKEAFDLLRPYGGGKNMITEEVLKRKKDTIEMNGQVIFEYATTAFASRIKEICEKANIKIEDIDMIIPHQANINIITTAMKMLNLPMEKTHITLDKFGNTGGSSAVMALKDAVEQNKIKKGDTVVVVQFGAGLASGATIMKWAY